MRGVGQPLLDSFDSGSFLYEVAAGRITVDGVDIRDLTTASLRSRLARSRFPRLVQRPASPPGSRAAATAFSFILGSDSVTNFFTASSVPTRR